MESAIPTHLQTHRTQPLRMPEGHTPPQPAFTARHRPDVERIVIASFGVQVDDADPPGREDDALGWLESAFADGGGPGHWDRARGVDAAGCRTVVRIAYWDDAARFDAWFAEHGATWTAQADTSDDLGCFVEVARPSVTRFTTLFSSRDRPEASAVLADHMSGPVAEHAYWGALRDRLALAQTSELAAAGTPEVVDAGSRQKIRPQENPALLRGGFDWSDTDEEERRSYLETIEPHLAEAMAYLDSDGGESIGCHTARYLRLLDADGAPLDKTLAVSWWESLEALEAWPASHPLHAAIFEAAMAHAMTFGEAMRLRLYFEIAVPAAHEQHHEYARCHARTGLLRPALAVAR